MAIELAPTRLIHKGFEHAIRLQSRLIWFIAQVVKAYKIVGLHPVATLAKALLFGD
jgi:hypothetical protein